MSIVELSKNYTGPNLQFLGEQIFFFQRSLAALLETYKFESMNTVQQESFQKFKSYVKEICRQFMQIQHNISKEQALRNIGELQKLQQGQNMMRVEEIVSSLCALFPQVTFFLMNKKIFNKEEGKVTFEDCPSYIQINWSQVVSVLQILFNKIDQV